MAEHQGTDQKHSGGGYPAGRDFGEHPADDSMNLERSRKDERGQGRDLPPSEPRHDGRRDLNSPWLGGG